MSAFVLTPQSPLCLRLPVLDWSRQNWHATAKLQVFKVLPQRYKCPHPSGVWIHLWDSRSRRAMTCVRNQAADTTSNSLEPGTVGTSLNSENVESYRLKEEFREETKTDHAMATKLSSASKADAEQKTGNLGLRLTPRVRRVAVIGAGAAGLVAARELDREGHEVVVYEQSDRVGGVWDYNPETEDDILGIRPDRSRVHSSMYKSLRTNLPRELMGFLDFPFLPKEDRDPRRFPGHQEVYLYLEDFAKEFDILQWVRFNTEVEEVSLKQDDEERIRSVEKQVADVTVSETHSHVYWNGSNSVASDINKQLARPNFDGPALLPRQSLQGSVSEEERREVDILSSQWVVRSRRKTVKNVLSQFEVDSVTEDVFDAVVVCNGHYSEPKIASIPGIEHWTGTVMHSHNYRVPTPFQGQVVVVIGSAPSGEDVSREVATVAKEVHVSARAWSSALDLSKPDRVQGNLWRHPMISCISNEGAVRFEDGSEVVADTIIHCTGYKYSFPFLEAQEFVSVEDNRVGPLFQHVFPPALAPHLSFVGLPYKVVPFPLCELQSQWIAKILSGKLSLPSPEQMMTAVHNFYTLLEALGYPKHYTHNMDLYQYAYSDWLAEQCEYEVQGWREEMYAAGRESKRLYPTTYRDIWTDQELMNIVYSKLLQFQHSRPAMVQNI